jgi:hypothetical protein
MTQDQNHPVPTQIEEIEAIYRLSLEHHPLISGPAGCHCHCIVPIADGGSHRHTVMPNLGWPDHLGGH